MSHDDESAEQRLVEELRALPKEREVSETQAAALAARLIPRRRTRRVAEIALAAALAGVAFLSGRMTAGGGTPPALEPNYVLLVHDDLPPHDEAKTHAEYAAWARDLAVRGRLAGGEELGKAPVVLAARGTGEASRIGGYFLLTARDDAEAQAIARDCPHLKHGGTLELRKVMHR
jgi:YCII-related domain